MKLNIEIGKEELNRIIEKSKTGYFEQNSVHSPQDAFMLLINGLKANDLDNLCKKLQSIYPQLEIEDIYKVTQGEFDILKHINPIAIKMLIYNCAMECIKEGKHLGNVTTPDGRYNTSSFITHSLYESMLAGELAQMIGADKNKAKTLAILHDYGRKFTHTFEHVPRGFEALVNEGWQDEAVATLTHSFLNGGRCANCDSAEEGFYIDEEGSPKWESEEYKDDVAIFLDGYKYSVYDEILNVSDLMATSNGIVSPSKRVEDIRSRKPADSKNEAYFLTEFINKLASFLNKMGIKYEVEEINPTSNIDEIRETFEKVSKDFYGAYSKTRMETR